MPLSLHPIWFMDKFATIDEKLPPSLRFFLCITIVGLAVGFIFFGLLYFLKQERSDNLKTHKDGILKLLAITAFLLSGCSLNHKNPDYPKATKMYHNFEGDGLKVRF